MSKLDSGKRLTAHQKVILNKLIEYRGDSDIGCAELYSASTALFNKACCYVWIRKWGYENRIGRGKYSLKALLEIANKDVPVVNVEAVA